MSSTVAGILQDNGDTGRTPNQKSNFDLSTAYKTTYRTATPLNTYNVEQTFLRQVDTLKGIVYSEDLPKLDYVSPTLHKHILEDVPESSTGSRCPSNNLSSLLTRNVELTNTVSYLLKTSIAPRTRTQYAMQYNTMQYNTNNFIANQGALSSCIINYNDLNDYYLLNRNNY